MTHSNALSATVASPEGVQIHLLRARLELQKFAVASSVLAPAVKALRRIETSLARPLTIAIVGEFNSGKSTLANLLVGMQSLPTSVMANTSIPTLITYAESAAVFAVYRDGRRTTISSHSDFQRKAILRLEVGLPVAGLRNFQFLDMPGLADPRFGATVDDTLEHRPDALIWCTVASQAWKASERSAWLMFPQQLRARSLLVATFADNLTDATEQADVLDRLQKQAGHLFREITIVATLDAQRFLELTQEESETDPRHASGGPTILAEVDRLIDFTRRQRSARAREMTARIASHALELLPP